jgi:hypothetical protein
MAVQAMQDGHEIGHLIGDVPALLLVAAVSGISLQRSSREWSAHSKCVALLARRATRLGKLRWAFRLVSAALPARLGV